MKLYNTLTRRIEDFQPIDPPNVGMYTCGPTVYREIHIGNFRTYITSDVLRRVLLASGYKVKSAMNITDVGHMRFSEEHHQQIDPIIAEALAQGKTPLEIAREYTEKFFEDSKKLNVLPHDVYPKATDHIKEMIEMIKILLDKGLAYEANGTIYFNVWKFKNYGKLSGNTLDKMDKLLEAVRISVETDKKDSADFALWKKAESGRLMRWSSPWGDGFPGWHIECSVMSMKYLGNHIDVHLGGEDLVFPHHEDEIAQSEGVTGKDFVNYWVHSNYLLVDGEKMSRSKRNVYTISDLGRKNFIPLAFRYLTYLTHYRTRMNFTWKGLAAAQVALDRIYNLAAGFDSPKIGCAEFEQNFFDSAQNDLNMPKAMSIMWEMLRSNYPTSARAESLYKMDEILGLRIREKAEELRNIPKKIKDMISERDKLRRAKKFNESDKVRAEIKKMGYVIEDRENQTVILRKI